MTCSQMIDVVKDYLNQHIINASKMDLPRFEIQNKRLCWQSVAMDLSDNYYELMKECLTREGVPESEISQRIVKETYT